MNYKLKNKITNYLIITITLIFVLICIIPFLSVISISLSSNNAIISQKVTLWPVGINFNAYKTVFEDSTMIKSMIYTIFITVLYSAISLFLTIIAAYPLTKKPLKGRKLFMFVIIITMYFSGGIIPDYMLVKNLHLLDTTWALILPGVVSVYNLIILKSFFTSIPVSLMEAAEIDGCTDIGVLIKIVLPLSLPILATLSLFYAVWRWNTFQDALFYITKTDLYPIQLKLYQIISSSQSADVTNSENIQNALTPEALKAASVVFATLPILIIYPWLQKYFVSGVMIGAVKE